MATSTSNPFDDPATQQAAAQFAAPIITEAAKNPAIQQAVFSAAMTQMTGPPAPPAAQNNSYDNNAYANDVEAQQPVNNQNNPQQSEQEKNIFKDTKDACASCSSRLPLQYLLPCVGVAFILAALFDFLWEKPDALDVFANMYLIIFGLLIIIIETPRVAVLRTGLIQDKVFYWAMFLSRLWGRAWFYFFLAILCLAGANPPKFWFACGVICLVVVMYFVGVSAARKLNRVYAYISAGFEGEERNNRVRETFQRLDTADMKYLIPENIHTIASEAGRPLSASECQVIFRFFNESQTGQLTLEEWEYGFTVVKKGLRSL